MNGRVRGEEIHKDVVNIGEQVKAKQLAQILDGSGSFCALTGEREGSKREGNGPASWVSAPLSYPGSKSVLCGWWDTQTEDP